MDQEKWDGFLNWMINTWPSETWSACEWCTRRRSRGCCCRGSWQGLVAVLHCCVLWADTQAKPCFHSASCSGLTATVYAQFLQFQCFPERNFFFFIFFFWRKIMDWEDYITLSSTRLRSKHIWAPEGGQPGCVDKPLQLGKSSISVQTYRRVFTITVVRRTNIRDDGKACMCIPGGIKFSQYKMASMSTTPPLPGCPPHSHLCVLHSQHFSLSFFKIQKTAASFYISVPTVSHSMHAVVGIFSQHSADGGCSPEGFSIV